MIFSGSIIKKTIICLSVILLLVFGCKPETKRNSQITNEISTARIEDSVDQKTEEDKAPVTHVNDLKPEPAVDEEKVEAAKDDENDNNKHPKEVLPVSSDVEQSADTENSNKEQTTTSAADKEVAEDNGKTAQKPSTSAKGESEDKNKNTEDDEQSKPKLVDTVFFKNCDYVFKNFVNKNGLVNYLTLRRKKIELLAAVKDLEDFPKEVRNSWSKDDEKAFLLNAHNLLMLHLIIDNYPIKPNKWMSIWFPANSIKHIPGAREKKYFRVSGLDYTLDELEETVLEKANDPRYCFALSNATMMGGKLRNEAYRPDKLDDQIDAQIKKYLQDPNNLKIDSEHKKIYLSSMFKLENFKKSFLNSKYADIKRFRRKDEETRAFLNFIYLNVNEKTAKGIESSGYEVDYLKYNWELNEHSLL